MSSSYNAVVREYIKGKGFCKVVSRILVSPETKLFPSWTLSYDGQRASPGTPEAKGFILASSETKPVQVYCDGAPGSRGFHLWVKTLRGDTMKISLHGYTVKDLKKAVEEKTKVPPCQQSLLFNDIYLDENKTLMDYSIRNGSVIYLTLVTRGNQWAPFGPTSDEDFENSDQEAMDCQNRKPFLQTEAKKTWLYYKEGLNFTGYCPNKDCISNVEDDGEVVNHQGYGTVLLIPNENTVPCPVCENGRFIPIKFLLCKCRALLRFKSVSPSGKVRQMLKESIPGSLKHVEFDSTWQWLPFSQLAEIRTVKENGSPYYCVACGRDIYSKDDEYVSKCGHSYHKKCIKNPNKGCQLCKAPIWNWKDKDLLSQKQQN